MGIEPETMAEAARSLDRMGFDIIDLNFACPVKKVVSHKRGGALMKDPARALATVRAVLEAVPGRPVTLKLRRSFRTSDTANEDFWAIARGAFEAGAAGIAVHARSVEQKYTGRADWGFLAEVKREFPDRTILGSGDVTSPAESLRMLAETGVDGVLAARGAIGNPWFFAQARDLADGRPPRQPPLGEQREVIYRHFGLASEAYDPRRGLKMLRHFSLQYAKMHPRRTDLRNALIPVRTEAEWRAVIDAFYGS
jgi:nifR3 family TIM-barrel protein